MTASDQTGSSPRRFALLDRDGTIIIDRGYLADPAGIAFTPGALAGLRLLRDAGIALVIVTNQSGIGRGYFDEAALAAVHARLEDMLLHEGIRLDAIYYCPHGPDGGCACRKPATGMVAAAMRDLGFGPGDAVFIGDGDVDMAMARAAGIHGIRVASGGGATGGIDFLEAAQLALAHFGSAAIATGACAPAEPLCTGASR